MKYLIYTILMYQVCGNEIVYIKDNAPFAMCNTTTRKCMEIDELGLILIRETSSCSRLKKFNIME
jgi:hypothetical protein